MTIVAPDAELIPAMRRALRATGAWDSASKSHVYAQFAPRAVVSRDGNVRRWCILRPQVEMPSNWRGDRMDAQVRVAVQSVGWSHADIVNSVDTILNTLHERGANDRLHSLALSATLNWHILSLVRDRAIRVVPDRALGFRWYEYGYMFVARMESKNAYI